MDYAGGPNQRTCLLLQQMGAGWAQPDIQRFADAGSGRHRGRPALHKQATTLVAHCGSNAVYLARDTVRDERDHVLRLLQGRWRAELRLCIKVAVSCRTRSFESGIYKVGATRTATRELKTAAYKIHMLVTAHFERCFQVDEGSPSATINTTWTRGRRRRNLAFYGKGSDYPRSWYRDCGRRWRLYQTRTWSRRGWKRPSVKPPPTRTSVVYSSDWALLRSGACQLSHTA